MKFKSLAEWEQYLSKYSLSKSRIRRLGIEGVNTASCVNKYVVVHELHMIKGSHLNTRLKLSFDFTFRYRSVFFIYVGKLFEISSF